MTAAFQILRLLTVVALLIVAAILATPKDRPPLALRGLMKILRRDSEQGRGRPCRGHEGPVPSGKGPVPSWKRVLSFLLVLLAAALALA